MTENESKLTDDEKRMMVLDAAKKRSNDRKNAANNTEFDKFLRKLDIKCASEGFIPIGKTRGFPILMWRRDKPCITLFYFTRQLGSAIKSPKKLYPVSHVVTALWPSGKIIAFQDLFYATPIDYTEPVGVFPHSAISNLSPKEYNEMRDRLMAGYNEFIHAVANRSAFSEDTRKEMGELLNKLMEPGLKEAYKKYGGGFFPYFCGKNWADEASLMEKTP